MKTKGYKVIRTAMRHNEIKVMAHLRKYRVNNLSLIGTSWWNAMDRLMRVKRIVYRDGAYRVRKGAQPATGAVR